MPEKRERRFLVRTLKDGDISAHLPVAYTLLAAAYCRRTATAVTDALSDWKAWRERVTERATGVTIEDSHGRLLGTGDWAEVEVLNGLNHIEVLLAALEVLSSLGCSFAECYPTQQSADPGAEHRACDLKGVRSDRAFGLEAYGGVWYLNNCKLAQDLKALKESALPSTYLAARRVAWPEVSVGKRIKATCDERHGARYTASAQVTEILDSGDRRYRIVQVSDIQIET